MPGRRKLGRTATGSLVPAFLALALACAACGSSGPFTEPPTATSLILKEDVLVEADLWTLEPQILSAKFAVTGIAGIDGLTLDDLPTSEQLTRAAGGTWNLVTGVNPVLGSYTSATTPDNIAAAFGYPVDHADGLPVVFSWPILPSTLDPTDFVVVLIDGTRVTPEVCAVSPNFDFNERAVAVLFGKFGNRLYPGEAGALYPVYVEVVADDTPLQLVGPGGRIVSAVGLNAPSGTAYTDPNGPPEERGGPRLVAAKLTRMSAVGDDAPAAFADASPNDGITLYGDRAQYRLCVYTSGGFSPDGVRGMLPTEFARYFRLQAGDRLLTETGVPYDLGAGAGSVTIVGLAELGRPADIYDDTYVEDQDNQIDIVLAGDEAAMRRITAVEVPSLPPYSPLYNPGGPGNQPTPGVRYTAPSPPHVQPVTIALGDPMTVTLVDPGPGDGDAADPAHRALTIARR